MSCSRLVCLLVLLLIAIAGTLGCYFPLAEQFHTQAEPGLSVAVVLCCVIVVYVCCIVHVEC
jgi:hypothetical protein